MGDSLKKYTCKSTVANCGKCYTGKEEDIVGIGAEVTLSWMRTNEPRAGAAEACQAEAGRAGVGGDPEGVVWPEYKERGGEES